MPSSYRLLQTDIDANVKWYRGSCSCFEPACASAGGDRVLDLIGSDYDSANYIRFGHRFGLEFGLGFGYWTRAWIVPRCAREATTRRRRCTLTEVDTETETETSNSNFGYRSRPSPDLAKRPDSRLTCPADSTHHRWL